LADSLAGALRLVLAVLPPGPTRAAASGTDGGGAQDGNPDPSTA